MSEITPGGVGSPPGERETDILDDDEEDEADATIPVFVSPSSAAIGRLSSNETRPGLSGSVRTGESSWSRDTETRHHLLLRATSDRWSPRAGGAALNGGGGWGRDHESPPSARSPPDTPPRGTSSREAVLRVAVGDLSSLAQQQEEEEMSSLATDMDESIEQLNRLILDLDPDFVPVSYQSAPLSRSASLHSNGLSARGQGRRAGWQQKGQASDVTGYSFFNSPSWSDSRTQTYSPVNGGSPLQSQLGSPHHTDSVDYGGPGGVTDSCGAVPSTPAFPVSPPTPYVKQLSEFSQLRTTRQREFSRASEDSLSFMDSMSHAGSTDAELFRAELCRTPDSCQGVFQSRTPGSSGSPLPHADRSTPPPAWADLTSGPLRSPFPPRHLTPLSQSSPRGGVRAPERETSSLCLGNGSALEHSLLEAMEGLGGPGFSFSLGPDEEEEGQGRGPPPPLLPQKRGGSELGEMLSPSPSFSGFSSPGSASSPGLAFSSPETLRGPSRTSSPGYSDVSGSKQDTVKFVQDTSKFWYKPDISRDQAISLLKDRDPGCFIVRDSHSFRGAYGLAMKVATPPPSVTPQSKKGDPSSELVRHFLIECTQKGVRLKGCPNEPYFGSLTALVCQHSITPLALPCKLILPDRDPMEELQDSSPQTATNSAADLLKQGAACNVWFLGSVELESLTGHQAVQKATSQTLAADPRPVSTVVHFKVSAQGITLTDNQRKLFFRRHYTVNTVIFCSLDPQARRWTRDGSSTAKIFGFVARKSQSGTENMCHLFAEHDPEQPASAIVNFVSKVMIGSHKK